MIGLSLGQSIEFQGPTGGARSLTVLGVIKQHGINVEEMANAPFAGHKAAVARLSLGTFPSAACLQEAHRLQPCISTRQPSQKGRPHPEHGPRAGRPAARTPSDRKGPRWPDR